MTNDQVPMTNEKQQNSLVIEIWPFVSQVFTYVFALRFYLLATILTWAAICRAFAVIGFFDFATRFGHNGLLLGWGR